jgi:protein O-mannosyl-transferase
MLPNSRAKLAMPSALQEMSTEPAWQPVGQMPDGKTATRLYIGLLLGVVVLVYANSLWNGFTMDDGLYILQNPQVTAPTIRGLFTPNQFSKVLRPLTFATFAVNWFGGHGQPLGFHAVNLLLHAGVVCLLYLLLRKLLAASGHGNTVAFAAALLFAVHPIHTEAVSSIVGRAELLAAGFLMAAWLWHLEDREPLALICFALALLSKESAMAFLPLVLVGDYTKGQLKSYLRYARIAGITSLYVVVLWRLQEGRFGTGAISKMDNPLASIPALWRILNALHVAWKYVALQVYPANLSCDYSFNQIPVYLDLRHSLPWVAATLAAIAVWIWAARKRKSGLVLAGGIYLCGFAITANVLMPVGTIMGERLAYFSSVGFCLLLALAWSWLQVRRRTLAFGVLAILVGALGIRTVVRNRDWKDDLTLYSDAVRAAPNSAKMHSNLGYAYLNQGNLDLARKELDAALQIYPNNPDSLEGYGLLESRTGNYQAAGRMMEAAFYTSARDNPNYDYMAVNLAALYVQTGHLDGALELLNREIAEAPDYGRAWSNRAVVFYKRGEIAKAGADAETALRLDPGNTQAQNVMRLLNTPAGLVAR